MFNTLSTHPTRARRAGSILALAAVSAATVVAGLATPASAAAYDSPNDLVIVDSQATIAGNVLSNDSTTIDSYARLESAQQPAAGALSLTSNGTYRFTAATGFAGTVTYQYSNCRPPGGADDCTLTNLTVVVGPTAVDDTVTTDPDTATSGSVATNDVVSATPTFSVLGDAVTSSGSLDFAATGDFTFTPTTGFTGSASYRYQVCTPTPIEDYPQCAAASVVIDVAAPTPTPTPSASPSDHSGATAPAQSDGAADGATVQATTKPTATSTAREIVDAQPAALPNTGGPQIALVTLGALLTLLGGWVFLTGRGRAARRH